jgi:hypothetical protein
MTDFNKTVGSNLRLSLSRGSRRSSSMVNNFPIAQAASRLMNAEMPSLYGTYFSEYDILVDGYLVTNLVTDLI